MGVDFDKQIGISRIEGNQIITEFQDIDGGSIQVAHNCTVTDQFGHCIGWRPVKV